MIKTIAVAVLSLALVPVAMARPNANVVGPGECLECHESEGKAWEKTHHFMTFKKLHKRKKAKEIAKKMGIKRIKKDATCAQCHYTTVAGKKKPSAGISCESCHGPAKDWIQVHNDYGGKSVKRETESAAHRMSRIKKAVAGGMIRPDDIYNVARNCFQCHTVPNEKLVEVGGHKAGSDFELVSWSQGEIRHNFMNSADGGNRPASAERKRILYVAGRILDLEYGLRGVAAVTKKSSYAVAMAKRVKRALGHVGKIKDATGDAALAKIYNLGKAAKLKPNNKAALMKTAKAISAAAQAFLKGNDGKGLAAVDSLIPSETKGTAVQ